MLQFIESICIKNGILLNSILHTQRMQQTQIHFYQKENCQNWLNELVIPHEFLQSAWVKCRLVYDTSIQKISYHHYTPKTVRSFQLVNATDLHYDYKYADRTRLDFLLTQKQQADEIILIQNGYVSDASYANLVFEDQDKNLFTPAHYLLNGIKRQLYLQEQKIIEKPILSKDFTSFKRIHLINALLDLEDICVNL